VIRAQVRTVADSEPRMLLETIVAATSPWVRIPRPPLRPRKTGSDLGLRRLSHCLLPCADTACMLFWALLASGQITLRKVDGWRTLNVAPAEQILDLVA